MRSCLQKLLSMSFFSFQPPLTISRPQIGTGTRGNSSWEVGELNPRAMKQSFDAEFWVGAVEMRIISRRSGHGGLNSMVASLLVGPLLLFGICWYVYSSIGGIIPCLTDIWKREGNSWSTRSSFLVPFPCWNDNNSWPAGVIVIPTPF